jgi:putative oxidoreductase
VNVRASTETQTMPGQRWLIAYSVAILRVSVGAVFLAFGALKLFPGVSPAQNLVETTTEILTFGLVPGPVALVGVALLECLIGLLLISGRALRVGVYLLGMQLIGILSPLVLLPGRLFDGPHGAPSLEGQYVLKDVVIVGAALVLAATSRGARLTAATQDERVECATVGLRREHSTPSGSVAVPARIAAEPAPMSEAA